MCLLLLEGQTPPPLEWVEETVGAALRWEHYYIGVVPFMLFSALK